MNLILLFGLFAAVIAVFVHLSEQAKDAKKARDREEQLNCARVVWPHCTMSDDGVIHVDMALEDKFRAAYPRSEAVRKEMFAASFKGRR